jgi:hypothetical protein
MLKRTDLATTRWPLMLVTVLLVFYTGLLNAQEKDTLDTRNYTLLLEGVSFEIQEVPIEPEIGEQLNTMGGDTILNTGNVPNEDVDPIEQTKSKQFKFRLNPEELYLLLPEAVHITENGEKYVDYFTVIPVMFRILQEQEKRIKILESYLEKKSRIE